MSAGVVIAGAGQAAASAAQELRKRGYDAPVTILGEEAAAPYQRPPLSKAYLDGDLARDRLMLRPDAWWESAGVTLRLGDPVTAIDRAGGCVLTGSGERIPYDRLILATGGHARRLPVPGADLPGVFVLRSLEDADALGAALCEGARLVIVGAGYIGLEVAASARKRGAPVTVVEAAERPMARTASAALGGWFGAIHRGYGVDMRLSARVAAITGTTRAEGVQLADGEIIPADLVLIAAGLEPADELARAAGLACADGVLVDAHARTEDEAIYAAGDVARFDSARYARSLRLESVQNAIDQAKAAAAAIAGAAYAYDPVPWFWSDQYELKLQIAGLIDGADQTVRRGDPEMGRFAIFHLKQGRLIACEAVNAPPEYMGAQKLIAAGASPDPEKLRDPDVAMRALLA